MEDPSEIDQFAHNPIREVGLEFSCTQTSSRALRNYLKFLTKSRTVEELHENIEKSIHKLNSLKNFRSCDVKVLPGDHTDSALVSFVLKDLKWWGLSLGTNTGTEGVKGTISGVFRNLLYKADQTIFEVDYKYNTGTYGYNFVHTDKLFKPGKLESVFTLQNFTEELDQNLFLDSYGGNFALKTNDEKHTFEVGKYFRFNRIAVENASETLLKEGLAATSKNYFCHNFHLDTTDSLTEPRKGFKLNVLNELAYSEDSRFHKFDLRLHKYLSLAEDITFQGTCKLGVIMPWEFTKLTLNDKYRVRHQKGFISLGSRQPPLNPTLRDKFLVEGDDLGKTSQLALGAKLRFYNVNFLKGIGLTPFIFGSLNCVDLENSESPRDCLKNHTRGAAGFGLRFSTRFGVVELTYSSKVWSKPGDVTAEFQILFED
mmetsp:Transcript_6851/g.10103  ORF Transcript_6851/g.10103 Transcript_6851/m.10103 type:complete len:428 (+) Transcript_6851:11-1294(+)|eukprot:CAMPEP_0202432366 /NCGR_PEP_ID=MMETSP1345-20130828/8979_1 /ASSEMBLY_ACC=CAM_ASM_000843 /TAXON_ID=342563 /ORGANISM="Fabrea Fabrea salina" /LENGTH=427 /DNA_ID=CAMNT_0049044361 /DNA_START=4 /DNA_END=1287 /DNA_ORIENTATION=-